MKHISLLLLLALAACSSGTKKTGDTEGSADGINFNVKSKTLGNGLKVIVVENSKLPLMSYYTYYQVGGKYETKGITGSSHFLEHMMFKGAKKYGPGEFDKIVEGNGGSNNAYTSNDLTVYYENLPSAHLEKIIDVEADRMQNLALIPASFESERQVVLSERKMRYENSDRGKIYLSMMKAIFKGTPYGTSVIGKVKDLKTVSRDQVFEYFKKFYAPNNAFIVIVGDVDADDVFAEVEERFGKIPMNKDLLKIKKDILGQKDFTFKGKYNGRHIKLKGTSPKPMFQLGFKGIKIGVRDAYILDVLSSVLGDGESSILTKKYVTNKNPLLANVSAFNYTLQDSGVFFIGGQLLKGRNLGKIKSRLLRTVRKSCEKDIDQRAVDKVVNKYIYDMITGLDTNAGIARFLGDREVYYGDFDAYKKEISTYRSVTAEEVKKACKQYLQKKDSIFLSIWNKH